jgi:hypothetical protein
MNPVYGSPSSGDLEDEMAQLDSASSERSSEVDNVIASQYLVGTLTEPHVAHL